MTSPFIATQERTRTLEKLRCVARSVDVQADNHPPPGGHFGFTSRRSRSPLRAPPSRRGQSQRSLSPACQRPRHRLCARTLTTARSWSCRPRTSTSTRGSSLGIVVSRRSKVARIARTRTAPPLQPSAVAHRAQTRAARPDCVGPPRSRTKKSPDFSGDCWRSGRDSKSS